MKNKNNFNAQELNTTAVKLLCFFIVIQAGEDYFTCKRTIEKGKNSCGKITDCKKTLQDCIEFFNSDWYRVLTNDHQELSAKYVIERLEEMVADKVSYPDDYKPFGYKKDIAELFDN